MKPETAPQIGTLKASIDQTARDLAALPQAGPGKRSLFTFIGNTTGVRAEYTHKMTTAWSAMAYGQADWTGLYSAGLGIRGEWR